MATESRSPREIERDIEAERARLRETVDEAFNRLTFEDAWNRAGLYMRDNRAEFGQTLGAVMRERPVGVALTAIGLAWLFFGPKSNVEPRRVRYGRHERDPRDFGADPLARQRDPVAGQPAARSAYASPTAPARPPSDAARTGSSHTGSATGAHARGSRATEQGTVPSPSTTGVGAGRPAGPPSSEPTAPGKTTPPKGDAATPGASPTNRASGLDAPHSEPRTGPKLAAPGAAPHESTSPSSAPRAPAKGSTEKKP
ncbi:DUF3618 domain-containing protein [Tranquillimonas alkanivorans]|uniref:DUF3618 domain-containing protein n=1 Tax=Tranquillimonas alkanivorans TaxID=441119 RepID=A0A1I5U8D5_9RHOB|nr:DUF3618 domain-containing protein [Tranquillimonas alkanivorans]SFP91541.1 Protein of unknown function [Tranquillimonas alkanivorans]